MKLLELETVTPVKTIAKRECPLRFQTRGVNFTKHQTIRVGIGFDTDPEIVAEAADLGLEFKLPSFAKKTSEVGILEGVKDPSKKYLWCLARGITSTRYFFGEQEVTNDPEFLAKLPERDPPEDDSLLYFVIGVDNIKTMREI